jgi:hypothetical protein
MAITGRLELTIKINEYPDNVKVHRDESRQFEVDCDGQIITVKLKLKAFKKLDEARANYPMWMATITGKVGEATPNGGFMLADPALQVFEKKPKEPKADSE